MADVELNNRLPLSGKRFFIDPKVERSFSKKLRQNLVLLGGVVEDFLDKNIHFALTIEENVPQKCEQPSSSNIRSPFSTSAPSPHVSKPKHESSTRSRRLASRAKSVHGSTNSLIQTAQKLGIKIRYVEEVWQWISKKIENLPKPEIKRIPQRPTEISLKEPCIKIEDLKHKPIYEEMEGLCYLDFEGSKIRCPFVNPASPAAKKPQKKKDADQKGFCECCQSSYLSESKHCKSHEHISYGESTSNYQKLDQYVSTNGLNLASFLKRARQIALKGEELGAATLLQKQSRTTASQTKEKNQRTTAACSSPIPNHSNSKSKTRLSLSPRNAAVSPTKRLPRPRVSISPLKTPCGTVRRSSPRKTSSVHQQKNSTPNKSPRRVSAAKSPSQLGRSIPKTSRSLSPVLSPRSVRPSTKRKLSVTSDATRQSSSPTRTRCLRSRAKTEAESLPMNARTRSRTLSRESIGVLLHSSNLSIGSGSAFLGF